MSGVCYNAVSPLASLAGVNFLQSNTRKRATPFRVCDERTKKRGGRELNKKHAQRDGFHEQPVLFLRPTLSGFSDRVLFPRFHQLLLFFFHRRGGIFLNFFLLRLRRAHFLSEISPGDIFFCGERRKKINKLMRDPRSPFLKTEARVNK
jgi:hypothetical protein